MKITGVELSSEAGNIFSFGTSEVSSSDKYLVKTIVGLDADEIHRKFYGFGAATQSRFYRYGVTKREIVIRAVLNPNYSINENFSDIRDDLYRTVSSSRTGLVSLLFTSGGAAVSTIQGYISKFEVPYFSQVPELQITIQCPDPMLRGFSPVELEAADLSTSNPLQIYDSLSTAPHGMSFTANCANVSGTTTFTIMDGSPSPDWTFSLRGLTGVAQNDKLVISSEYDTKSVYLIQGSTITDVADKIEPESLWPILFPGDNEFNIYNLGVDWTVYALSYKPAYWGI